MGDTNARRPLIGGAALLTFGMVLTFLLVGLSAARAETGKKALILGSSVTGGAASSEAAAAEAKGFVVTVVDDPTWGGMTAAQFADYQLLVVGDPTCSTLPKVVSDNAAALADAVMARAGGNTKVGNRVLIGTDPRFHFSQGGGKLIAAGIDFAGVQEGASGLYLNFTCNDGDYNSNGIGDGQEKLLPLLTADPTGTWTQNSSPPCGGDVSLISNAAQFSTLASSDLRGWSCSVHETFPTFPTDWTALAIATDTTTKPTCGTDVDTGEAKCGEAYVLISGSGIVVESPNLSLAPTTATNPTGTPHTVTATVTNPNGSPRSGVVVSFVVTGVNAGATGVCVPSTCTTGADGKVTFTYTGTNEGDDTINAAITVDGSRQSATASKTWTKVAGGTGSITIIKSTFRSPSYHVVFPFIVTGPSASTFELDTDPGTATPDRKVLAGIPSGTYTVRETPLPLGWEFHRFECNDHDGGTTLDPATATATIDLDPGESITCTYYNVRIRS